MSESLYTQMMKKASEACYWKEDAIDRDDWHEADEYRLVEAIWNQAAELVKQSGLDKE